ncbi:MAG: ArsB/NhaD family transporter [Planctomycetes bacterium]|nr:ArsB/NhaD family transporter [Planctomycetota bacterium]
MPFDPIATLPGDPHSDTSYWLALTVFVATFAAVVSDKIHKTKAALFGGATVIVLGVLTQDEALHSMHYGIDYGVVFLLIGMMVLVNVLGQTGIFGWAAIKVAKLARGRPLAIMAWFCLLTATASALLDNVTTVLLVAPVTLLITEELELDPIPFLLAEAMASNIGGTATLIGDPPNILIAARARLTFDDFLIHLAPAVAVMMAVFLAMLWLLFRRGLRVDEQRRQRILAMSERRMIKDARLAVKALIVLAITLTGFVAHSALELEPATVALFGASLLLLISRGDPARALAEVEWPTIFFFIGLFLVIGGIVKVGIVREVSAFVIDATGPTPESMQTTAFSLLWFSASLSAVIDNIPYVATMNPLVLDMANTVLHGGTADPNNLPIETLHSPVLQPVWWSFALGSCLGGNATAIGASANVVIVGIAARAGRKISFGRFLRFGLPTMLVTVGIAQVYLLLRYY